MSTSPSDNPVDGGPGVEAPPPLESRLAQSPIVVTGTIVSIETDVATIEVSQSLKGDVSPGALLPVSIKTPAAVGVLALGDSGVWLVSSVGTPRELLGGGPVGVTEDAVRAALAEGS